MTIDEQITIFEHNAENERQEGDLQGCLNFRQLADWLKDYKRLLEQEPCEDAISRQAVIDALTKTSGIRGDALKALYDLLPVQPKQKVGHDCNEEWVEDGQFICSECGLKMRGWYGVKTHMENAREWDEDAEDEKVAVEQYEPEFTIKYCPICGTKMEGSRNETN